MGLLWVCRDGRAMRVAEMADGHPENAIAMIERGKGWRMKILPRLYLERGLRKVKRRRYYGKEERGAQVKTGQKGPGGGYPHPGRRNRTQQEEIEAIDDAFNQ